MKNFLLLVIAVILIFIAIKKDGIQKLENKLAFRGFTIERDLNGSISSFLESDIPNYFVCTEDTKKTRVLDINGKEMDLFGAYELNEGENGNKVFKIIITKDGEDLFGNKLNNVDYINTSYFCVSPDMLLNNKLIEYSSSISDTDSLEKIYQRYPINLDE